MAGPHTRLVIYLGLAVLIAGLALVGWDYGAKLAAYLQTKGA